MAPQGPPYVFERFHRAKGPHKKNGPGPGLHISRRLVEPHSDRLCAESEVEMSTTFHFTLPLAQDGV
ncbi:MAG: ATP-binding protein [Chloroflexota bacterium]